MTVSCLNRTDVSSDKDMGIINRQKPPRAMREVKSSPTGVDWQMIRTMRESGRYREDYWIRAT